jgi:putative hemolysin
MNNLTLMIEGAGLFLLLLCSAFFSSAETALFSLNPIQIHRIRRQRPRVAERIDFLLRRPSALLSTILIGNTIVNVAAAALAYVIAEGLYKGYGEAVSIPVITLLLLVFGEVAPKRLALLRAERMATSYAAALTTLMKLLSPIRRALEAGGRPLTRDVQEGRRSLTEDEFLTVVEEGEEQGVLDEEERTMVDGIIGMEDMQVSDIMTPRVDLVGIDLEDPPDEQEAIARSARFRYLPVYRGSLDRPEAFLDVPRFLLAETPDLAKATIPPFFVPETTPLDTLLATFRRENCRVAMVADEYGGTAGLVTRGDILEEIVEDVGSEYGDTKLTIQEVGRNHWLLNGSTSLEDLNYELDLQLDAEGADRIAGWVAAQQERMPRTGDLVEAQGCRVHVTRVRRNRILTVLLEKMVSDANPEVVS